MVKVSIFFNKKIKIKKTQKNAKFFESFCENILNYIRFYPFYGNVIKLRNLILNALLNNLNLLSDALTLKGTLFKKVNFSNFYAIKRLFFIAENK